MATIATLAVDLVANTKKFVLPTKNVNDFAKSVQTAGNRINGFASAVGLGVSVGGLVALGAAAMRNIDHLNDMSQSLGLSVKELSQLEYAAQQAGISGEALEKSIGMLNRKLVGAEEDGGAASDALAALGLTAKQLLNESPAKALGDIADAFQRIQNPSQRAALAFQLFGREGIGMSRMLADGSRGLADMAREADALGRTISDLDAAKIALADDAMVRLKSSFGSLVNEIAIELSPALAGVANDLAKIVSQQRELNKGGGGWKDWFAAVGGYTKDLASFLGHSAAAFGLMAPGIGAKVAGAVFDSDKLRAAGKQFEKTSMDEFARAGSAIADAWNGTSVEDAKYFFEDVSRSADKSGKAAVEAANAQRSAMLGLSKEQRKLADSIQGTIDKLREQVQTFGMSAEQIEIWKLQQQGADAGTIAMASSLANQIEKLREAADAQKQMADEAARLNEQFQSPMSKYEGTISRLGELLNNGAIGWDVYGSAVRQAREELERASRASERRGREVGRADIFGRAAASLPGMPPPNAPIAEIPGLRGNVGGGKKIEVKGQDKMLDLLEQIRKGVVDNQNILLG